jgi:hypothetical protein
MISRNSGSHFLALASATTAVVGLSFDDVKWAISVAASFFGSAVALYIFREQMRSHAEKSNRAEPDQVRLQAHSQERFDDWKRGEAPGEGARESTD